VFPGRRFFNGNIFSGIRRLRKVKGTFAFVEAARGRQGTVCKPELGDRIIVGAVEVLAWPTAQNMKTGMLPVVPRLSVLSYAVLRDVKGLEVCSHGNKSSVF
jgi:hypothetical protein